MPSISVRQLDAETLARLRVRAAEHGVSMEEEVRRILRQAVSASRPISAVFREHFGPEQGVLVTETRRDLSDVAGSWQDDPQVDEALEDQRRVDSDLW